MKTLRIIAAAFAFAWLASSAQGAPSVDTTIESFPEGVVSSLASRGFASSSLVSPELFDGRGTIVSLAESDFAPHGSVDLITLASRAELVSQDAEPERIALVVAAQLPSSAFPYDGFGEHVPAGECDKQARFLDESGYVLVMTTAGRERAIIGPRDLGAPMTWFEARQTGIVAQYLNGGVKVVLVMTNEPGDQTPYAVDSLLRPDAPDAATGMMLIVPDGAYDDRVESEAWCVRVRAADGSGSSGCSVGAAALAAAALIVARRAAP